MTDRTAPKLPKWPFLLADVALLAVAWLIFSQSTLPMTVWNTLICAAGVALGAVLGVSPYLLEYRAAVKWVEADRLTNAVLQIQNIEIVGRQITNASANWQAAHEHSTQSVEAAREITGRITAEARAFTEFLKNANETEKNHLRLEVDKLRRVENEWLQVLVRVLDHVFALCQAASQSGPSNLVRQLGHFQNACRDAARRVGLVPFIALPGELYDSKLHQLADAKAVPSAEARIAETLATGYSFQGQLVRPALVALQSTAQSQTPVASSDPTLDRPGVAPVQNSQTQREFSEVATDGVPDGNDE
jgi:molecular chaperone GrpE (heat shock protein)